MKTGLPATQAGLPVGRPIGRAASRKWKPTRGQMVLLLAAALLSIYAGYTGFQRFSPAAQVAPTLQTTPARTGSLVSTISATGSVVIARQSKLSFTTSGKLAQLNVGVGDTVKAGQELARLDTKPLEIKLAQAESALKVSQIKLQQLKDGATAEEVAIARANYDSALAKYQVVEAGATDTDLQSAQSGIDQATANLAVAEAKLADLKKGPTQAELDSARAAVGQAKVNLDSARTKLDDVKAGHTQSEWTSAFASVESARLNLTNAQTKLDDLKARPTLVELASAQSAIDSAKSSLISAQDKWEMAKGGNLAASGFTSNGAAEQNVVVAQAKYDAAVQELKDVQAGAPATEIAAAEASLKSVQASFDVAAAKVEDMKRGPLPADISAAEQSYESAKAALATAELKLEQLNEGPTEADLLSAESAVGSARVALASAEAKLEELLAGPGTSDLASARSSLLSAQSQLKLKTDGPQEVDLLLQEEQVRQSETSLDQVKLDLENATLIAPFDGVVSAASGTVGEQASAGAAVITLLDPKSARIDVTVDETDVVKMARDQQSTVTFDALPDTTVRGRVISVAPSGATQQGVVSYLVSIGVDLPEGRSLPSGMSAIATIETERKDGVLLVPNRAVRTSGRNRIVEVLAGDKTEVKTVQVGSSNDQFTQIVSGLAEGDQVVIPVTTTRTTGLVPGMSGGAPGGGGMAPGGGAIRVR